MSSRNDSRRAPGASIRRRDLLVWGSVAALAPALPRLAHAQAATASGTEQPWRSMSVGFVAGSDTWPSFKAVTAGTLARGRRPEPGAAPQPIDVLSAAEMPLGNQQLVHESVRVGVHGLYPIPNPTRVARVDLTVLFPSPEPGVLGPLPFYAWSYRNKPAPSPSPPLKFVLPVGGDGSLQLLLDVVPGDERQLMTRRATLGLPPDGPGGRFAADFTVDWYEGRPKLQRGVYLLGLAGNTWAASRTLPIHQPRATRPLELLSLIVSIDAIEA
jgi:hypothetical protein